MYCWLCSWARAFTLISPFPPRGMNKHKRTVTDYKLKTTEGKNIECHTGRSNVLRATLIGSFWQKVRALLVWARLHFIC